MLFSSCDSTASPTSSPRAPCSSSRARTTTTPRDRPAATALKDAYRDAFKVGVAINAATAFGTDSATQALVVREFNSITADNFLKAALVNPQPGVYDFRAGDAFVALGERQKMFIVGHTLVWHNQTPPWFFTIPVENPTVPNNRKRGCAATFRPWPATTRGASTRGTSSMK